MFLIKGRFKRNNPPQKYFYLTVLYFRRSLLEYLILKRSKLVNESSHHSHKSCKYSFSSITSAKAETKQVTHVGSNDSICCNVRNRISLLSPSPYSLFSLIVSGGLCFQTGILNSSSQAEITTQNFISSSCTVTWLQKESSQGSQKSHHVLYIISSIHTDTHFLFSSTKPVSDICY